MRMWSALLVVGIVATLCRSGEGTTVWHPDPYYQYQYVEQDRTLGRANAGTSHSKDHVISQEPRKTVIRDSSSDVAYANAETESQHERRITKGQGGYPGQNRGHPTQKGVIPVEKGVHSGPKEVYSGRGQYIKPENSYPQGGYTSGYLNEKSEHSARDIDDRSAVSYDNQRRNGDFYEQNRGAYSLNHKESQVDDSNSRTYGYNDQRYIPRYNQGYDPRYNRGQYQGHKKVIYKPINTYPVRQEQSESHWNRSQAETSAEQERYAYDNPHGSGSGEHSGTKAKAASAEEDKYYKQYTY